jgi:hypothetical protein
VLTFEAHAVLNNGLNSSQLCMLVYMFVCRVPFLIPTVLIGMDFIWVTWNTRVIVISRFSVFVRQSRSLMCSFAVDDDRLCALCGTVNVGSW